MTPEQRFTKLENLRQTLMEMQAQHQEKIQKLSAAQDRTDDQLKRTDEQLNRTNRQISDLGEHVRLLTRATNRLADLQEITESRLISLIEHVDRVVGRIEKFERQ